MLKEFSVTNFKNYKNKAVFKLDNPNNYEFNDEIINNGIITKGIVYGINGSGKSNLALALFDIVVHLTEKEKLFIKYAPYLNLDSNKPCAEFKYVFCFNGMDVVYTYEKKDVMTLLREKLTINGEEVLEYDFSLNGGYTSLKGVENLALTAKNDYITNRNSRVKYVFGNSEQLEDNPINKTFIDFMKFVDGMLMFYCLDEKGYQGFMVGPDSYTQGIIRENKLQEFENFLREQGIDYNLVSVDVNGVKEIYCKFAKQTVPFMSIASTGTKSLALFYYWYLKMSKVSFAFVDEFDAFYHFELSQTLISLIKKLKNTQIFFSTHNTDLLSNDILRPDAYFIIANNKIESINELSKERDLRKAHNIQKMYKAGTFNAK